MYIRKGLWVSFSFLMMTNLNAQLNEVQLEHLQKEVTKQKIKRALGIEEKKYALINLQSQTTALSVERNPDESTAKALKPGIEKPFFIIPSDEALRKKINVPLKAEQKEKKAVALKWNYLLNTLESDNYMESRWNSYRERSRKCWASNNIDCKKENDYPWSGYCRPNRNIDFKEEDAYLATICR